MPAKPSKPTTDKSTPRPPAPARPKSSDDKPAAPRPPRTVMPFDL